MESWTKLLVPELTASQLRVFLKYIFLSKHMEDRFCVFSDVFPNRSLACVQMILMHALTLISAVRLRAGE